MWKHWFMVLCFGVVCSHILPSAYGDLQDVATLCPYNNFCNSNATKSRKPDETHLSPCCQRCSCDPDCQLFGNCCPDVKLMPGVQQKQYPCVGLDTYYNEPRGIRSGKSIDIHYRLVDTCPNAGLDLVYARCLNYLALEDFIFVTDPLTERVYRNKHCAMCNGVKEDDLIQWKLITNCIPELDYPSMEDWHDHIISNCSLIPYPPDPKVSQLVQCIGERFKIIARCNSTGNWDTYNQDIKNACELENTSTPSIYTREYIDGPFGFLAIYYSNVYCSVCNKHHDEILTDLCEDIGKVGLRGGTASGFSVFINFIHQPADDEIKTERCDPTQIWNPFNESCMSVRCPLATYAYNGKCEDLHKNLPGKTYEMVFQLISSDDVYSFELQTFLDLYVTNMVANADCHKCGTSVQVDSNSNFVLVYSVNAEGTCTEDFIVSKMRMFLEQSPIYLRFGNMTLVSMVPELSLFQPVREFHQELIINTKYCPLPTHLTWAMVDKCPRIPITSFGGFNGPTNIKTERNGTICVDEYFRIMTSLNKSQTSVPYHVFMYMVVVVSIFRCTT